MRRLLTPWFGCETAGQELSFFSRVLVRSAKECIRLEIAYLCGCDWSDWKSDIWHRIVVSDGFLCDLDNGLIVVIIRDDGGWSGTGSRLSWNILGLGLGVCNHWKKGKVCLSLAHGFSLLYVHGRCSSVSK